MIVVSGLRPAIQDILKAVVHEIASENTLLLVAARLKKTACHLRVANRM